MTEHQRPEGMGGIAKVCKVSLSTRNLISSKLFFKNEDRVSNK